MKPTIHSRLIMTTCVAMILVTITSFAEPLAGKPTLTPQQLRERITELESTAQTIADGISSLRKQESPANETTLTEQQKELRKILTEVFDLKLSLEDAQIRELRVRLDRFEQQLRQRKDQREKIVEYRATQLVDKSGLDWTPVVPPVSVAVSPTEKLPLADTSKEAKEDDLQSVLDKYFPEAELQVHKLIGGRVLINGTVSDVNTLPKIMDIANVYSPHVLYQVTVKPRPSDSESPSTQGPTKTSESATPKTAQNNSQQPGRNAATEANNGAATPAYDREKIELELARMRTTLAPFAKEMTDAAREVRGMEEASLRSNRRSEKFEQAFARFVKSRDELRTQYRGFEWVKGIVERTGYRTGYRRGEVTDGNRLNEFQLIISELNPLGISLEPEPPLKTRPALGSSTEKYRTDVAQAFLQAKLNTKLELVSCEGLGLWFTKALRVRENGSQYDRGDLIVQLNGITFDDWDQALRAMKSPILNAPDTGAGMGGGVVRGELKLLQGGLAGSTKLVGFSVQQFPSILDPSQTEPQSAQWQFEVVVKDNEANNTNIVYLNGICISPLGLVVIPVDRRMIADGDSIRVSSDVRYRSKSKMSVRVVDADVARELTLVQVFPGSPEISFNWLSCISTPPSLHQLVGVANNDGKFPIVDINQPLPPPLVGRDGFNIGLSNQLPVLKKGEPILSFDGNLQGILLEDTKRPSIADKATAQAIAPGESLTSATLDEKDVTARYMALPALHIEKLLMNYLEKAAP